MELPISFFDPYFFLERGLLEKAEEKRISLAGLALTCKKSTVDGMKMHEGPLYDEQLAKFLSDNPTKTKEDFPYIFISLTNICLFVPQEYVPAFEYRCPVLKVDTVSFLNHDMYKLCVPIIRDGDTAVYCNLYVSEHILNGYIPCAGDDIEGVMWMNGHIARSDIKKKNGDDAYRDIEEKQSTT